MTDRDPQALAHALASELDRGAERPISQQIADSLWTWVIDGTLKSGERLPTVRQLAIELGVSPKIVERGYAELGRRGVIAIEADGVFVRLAEPDEGARERANALESACLDLVDRAEALGFSMDDVIETLVDIRGGRGSPKKP